MCDDEEIDDADILMQDYQEYLDLTYKIRYVNIMFKFKFISIEKLYNIVFSI